MLNNNNIFDLYSSNPEWRAQIDAVAKAAKDKGKAEAANDEAVKSAQNVKDTVQQIEQVVPETETKPSGMMNQIRTINDNAKDQSTEPSFNIGGGQIQTKQWQDKNLKRFNNGKASTAQTVQGYRDGYITKEMIMNNPKLSEDQKNEYISNIEKDETHRIEQANKKATTKDTTKDNLQTKLKNKTLTQDEYQKSDITAKDVYKAGYPYEEAVKLYPAGADLSILNTAYGKTAQPAKKDNGNIGAEQVNKQANPDDSNYSVETKQALQDAKSTMDKDSQKKETASNIKDYSEYSTEWNQEDIKPIKNLVDAYKNNDIDGKTFMYYLSDWIGTGLRNASHFTPGAYGGNKQAETSKWDTLQANLAGKQADLSYAQKSADIANKQNIAGNSTGAVQGATNTANLGGVEITKDFYKALSSKKIDAKGRMEAIKEYAKSNGMSDADVAKGILREMAINGDGNAQIIGALGAIIPQEDLEKMVTELAGTLGAAAKGVGTVANAVNGLGNTIDSSTPRGFTLDPSNPNQR